MQWLFSALELEQNAESRRRVDEALRWALGKTDAGCPEVWSAIKGVPEGDRTALLAEVAEHLREV